ncbi:MAG TPA: MFS transporter [Hyphomicrobiaceae bacterium]|jgi:MFS family permease
MTLELRVLVWMCVLVAVNQLGFGAMVPSLALYAQSFGVAASAIGLAVAAYGLARFATALPAGQLSDQLGRRPTLAIGGLVSAFGNLWCAWASAYPEFIVARFVAGAGAGLILTTGQVVLADISTPERRGRMIAIYQGTFLFAVGIGPFPGGLLAEHYGLAAPFVAYGTASALATIVAWFAVQETRELSRSQVRAGDGPRPPFAEQLRLLLGKPGFALVSLISLMNAVVRTGGLFAIVPMLATALLGLTTGAIGFALMVGSVCGLVAAYPAGSLADRFGRKTVIVPATVMTGVSMLLFCFAPTYAWFVAACIAWGVASSVGGSAPAAYAADSAPPGMNAAAMSTFRMMGDAGYVIGPLALGLVADIWGPVTALLVSASLLVAVGAAFALIAPETHRGHAPAPKI